MNYFDVKIENYKQVRLDYYSKFEDRPYILSIDPERAVYEIHRDIVEAINFYGFDKSILDFNSEQLQATLLKYYRESKYKGRSDFRLISQLYMDFYVVYLIVLNYSDTIGLLRRSVESVVQTIG